jgi:hypothetical protein
VRYRLNVDGIVQAERPNARSELADRAICRVGEQERLRNVGLDGALN